MELRSIGGEPVVLLDTYEVDEAQGPTGPHPSGFPAGAKVARVARFASVDVVGADTLDPADTPQRAPSVSEVTGGTGGTGGQTPWPTGPETTGATPDQTTGEGAGTQQTVPGEQSPPLAPDGGNTPATS